MQNLDEAVLERLLDADVDSPTIDLILAALDGPEPLDALLAGGTAAPRPDPAAPRVTPQGAYLTEVAVEGFRGVGRETKVKLAPGPGLTVIAGRNGSGKTSIAEALECALTGTARRWERAINAADARGSWRNLHHPDPCVIKVGLCQERAAPATITVQWSREDTRADQARRTYQRRGEKQQDAASVLGWAAALDTYQPLMSYEDLGRLVSAKPSEFHDSIARALALDPLHDAVALLKDRIRPLQAPMTTAQNERKALRERFRGVEDPRGVEAVKLLGKTSPDLDVLRRLVTEPAAGERARVLQEIENCPRPDPDEARTAADALDVARARLAEAGAERDRLERLRDQLLADALEFHREAGDGPCPVCETGRLDGSWRARVESAAAEGDLLQSARQEAEAAVLAAGRAARLLLQPPPPVLAQTAVELTDQSALQAQWLAWAAADDQSVSARLRDGTGPLLNAIEAWQRQAADIVAAEAASWAPHAVQLAGWIDRYEEARQSAAQADRLERAEKSARAVEQTLQRERLQPIVDRTRRIWSQLRQESNVDLVDIRLTGSATRRAVDISALVDGTDSKAFSVMSQGELNSLALALYLPRATSDESPFRFLVLDDPVQAMDPTKVEGLARVLSDLAGTRQVVVFTHDDRLAQAVDRLGITATVLQVTREPRSEVVVQAVKRPAERHLDDAYALLKATDVDDQVRRLVLPGLLRQAVEAGIWSAFAERELGAGRSLDTIEKRWDDTPSLRGRLELLLESRLESFLNDPSRQRTVRSLNRGTHQAVDGDPGVLYEDARRLARAVEGVRR